MLSVVSGASASYFDKPLTVLRGQSTRLPWAWDSLVFAVPFNTADNLGCYDVVNNVAPSVMTSVAFARDSRGSTVCNLSASAYIEYADHPRHDLPSQEITAYVRFMRNGAGDSYGGVFSMVWGEGSPWTTWAIGDSSAGDGHINSNIVAPLVTDFHGSADTSTIMSSTEYVSAFLRWRTVNVHTMHVLNERGASVDNISDDEVTTGPLLYAAGKGIRINGNEQEPPDSFNAKYSQCMVWSRRLGDAEMTQLVQDPYGWYSPRRAKVTAAAPFPIGPGYGDANLLTLGAYS